jgi:hypothetical protein
VLVLVLVLSAAVLVLETAHYDLVLEHRDHAWHCIAIQSRPAFSAVESQRDGHVIASDANPRSRDKTNSQSRNATTCVNFGCDSEHEHEHEHRHGNGQLREGGIQWRGGVGFFSTTDEHRWARILRAM